MKCKKVLYYCLCYTSDWFMQQNSRKLCKGACMWILVTKSYMSLNKTDFGGGGVLPYKGLMGTCGQSGYVFRDFVSIRVSILSFFVLIGVSISSIFVLNRGIDLFLDDKQPGRMFYRLNYSKIYIYYCLTRGMVSG